MGVRRGDGIAMRLWGREGLSVRVLHVGRGVRRGAVRGRWRLGLGFLVRETARVLIFLLASKKIDYIIMKKEENILGGAHIFEV